MIAIAADLPTASSEMVVPMKADLRLLMTAIGVAALLLAGAGMAQASSARAAPRMKAIVHHDYGSPDVLRLEEIEKPDPKDDEVLVRVRAASLNPLDWHYLRGLPYFLRAAERAPFKPKVIRLGVDVAGEVEAVGKNVTQFKPGDAVFGARFGALAQYVCAKESSLVLKSPDSSFEEAATVPIAGLTALQGLRDKGKIQPGQKVLINGASGGVGTFAVQIAKSFGADVTAVCSTRNMDMVRSIGADHVIDYTREDFTKSERRYDLILDMVGTHSFTDYTRAMTSHGKLVVVGSVEKGRWLAGLGGMLQGLAISRFVSQDIVPFIADTNQEDLTIIRDLMQTGKVKPVIDRRYSLREVPAAFRYLEEGHARGKIVVVLGDDDETAPVSSPLAVSSLDTIGPALLVFTVMASMIGVPVAVALALHRRFRRRHTGQRPFRWGYYFSVQSFVAGVALAIVFESGAIAFIVCSVVYGVLAWFFAQRRHWAWVTLTLFSFNPVVWIINFIYLRKRWAEDSVATPA